MKSAIGFALLCISLWPSLPFPKDIERIRNNQVLVTEVVLAPDETEKLAADHPSVTVYWKPASFEVIRSSGNKKGVSVTEGESLFDAAEPRSITNTGPGELRYTRVEFLGTGSSEIWGTAGLSPKYKVLLENRYARVYDIRIPAHTVEPQHTHHDRVVVCLSGATLKHRYADGHEEESTLKTGETAWRRGGTHVGQNLGDTNLWAIAIEPK